MEADKRYGASEKGKAVVERYQKSEKGKKARERYLDSEKGKTASLRYRTSEKGKKNQDKVKEKRKIMSLFLEFQLNRPGATFEDFLTYLKEKEGDNNART